MMNPGLIGLLQNIIVGVVTSLLTSLILWIGYKTVKNRLHTKRILKSDDKDIERLIDTYEAVMPDNYRSSATDIVRWLEEYQKNKKDPNHTLEEYWLVGKCNGQVISFLFFQYYTDARFLFISYMGVDKHALRTNGLASKAVLADFKKRLKKDLEQCRGIVYETAFPNPMDNAKLRRHKRARNELFKLYAKQQGFTAYELNIDYVAPKVSIEPGTSFEEERLSLSYIPLKTSFYDHEVSKDQVIEILKFVYLQVYGDSYREDDEMDKQYKAYLSDLLNRYTMSLPDRVQLL